MQKLTHLSGIRDNNTHGSVADFLQTHIQPSANLSIISAYFTLYAFEPLEKELTKIKQLRFLFGEPHFILDPRRKETKSFGLEDSGITLQNQLRQKPLAKACADWIQAKVAIKSIKQAHFLHGKLYHIEADNREYAILGSSNFTQKGLGLAVKNNLELNLIIDSDRDRHDLKNWFDELWNNKALVKDVKAEVLDYLQRLYADNTPQFIYYKTIYHIFSPELTRDNTTISELPTSLTASKIWQSLFSFQQNGAKSAINKLRKHNGCILADSVGLGKTYEALAIIKYFEQQNDRVLVLCPKRLSNNWTIYQASQNHQLNPFLTDRFKYHVLAHTDLSREQGQSHGIDLATFNWSAFDLVVIDESHNFRNDNKGKRSLSRYERLLQQIIQQGHKTKVLLISATPVNTDLQDLYNQIRFIAEDNDHAFQHTMGISSIKQTLNRAQKVVSDWTTQRTRTNADLMEKLPTDFFKLLDELTISRSRQHIQKYYPDTLNELGGFPKRNKPLAVYTQIDKYGKLMTFEALNAEILQYKLTLFNPSAYLRPEYDQLPEYQAKVKNFNHRTREHYLIGMMKMNFLKRLESSIAAFTITMERTVNKIENLIQRIEQFQQFRSESLSLDEPTWPSEAFDDEELADAFAVGSQLIFPIHHLDTERWLIDLKQDYQQLCKLRDVAKTVTVERDAKLSQLKALIMDKTVSKPTVNKNGEINRKVLIFTAFSDTARYLYHNLQPWLQQELKLHVAMVSGTEVKTTFPMQRMDFNTVLLHFSPRAKNRSALLKTTETREIDILIATDCIAEGQNLQDCDYVINYDIHWNPVRLIQRFGRIDRIGSLNETVSMVNFWATEDLEVYLNLKSRVEARMALVDLTATGRDNFLTEPVETPLTDELHYRDQQLKRMMEEEILDLETFDEMVSLADFSLEDFRADLHHYLTSKLRELAEAPFGLYAVVPAQPPMIQPGVIFCLQQNIITTSAESIRINPLQPFFLVYVLRDGTVHYNFTHPKQILTIFKNLCADVTTVYEDLCHLFDVEIQHGQNMQFYTGLLNQAFEAIAQHFQQRAVQKLQQGRSGLLPLQTEQVNHAQDFTLVTWLVIKTSEKV
ncbi:MAG: ATP-dependent helicase [Beggiatoa sp. IS2]|nr:MAG: ATP-dependent helicase [Beggiatoa sp. IS2]